MVRGYGSGRLWTVSKKENMDWIEQLVCSQEERPHTHLATNRSQLKCLKKPQISEGTQNRRETRAGSLRERFESDIRMIEKTAWQDKKDFTLEVLANLQKDRIYGKGNKSDIPDENLISLTNKMSKKLMVSAVTSWLQHHNQTFFCK